MGCREPTRPPPPNFPCEHVRPPRVELRRVCRRAEILVHDQSPRGDRQLVVLRQNLAQRRVTSPSRSRARRAGGGSRTGASSRGRLARPSPSARWWRARRGTRATARGAATLQLGVFADAARCRRAKRQPPLRRRQADHLDLDRLERAAAEAELLEIRRARHQREHRAARRVKLVQIVAAEVEARQARRAEAPAGRAAAVVEELEPGSLASSASSRVRP